MTLRLIEDKNWENIIRGYKAIVLMKGVVYEEYSPEDDFKKILKVKDKLLRMTYNPDEYVKDIDRVYELKKSVAAEE